MTASMSNGHVTNLTPGSGVPTPTLRYSGKEMVPPAGGMTPTLAATRDALFERTVRGGGA
jgi:hypothetical protein